jgi:hypothetical protein
VGVVEGGRNDLNIVCTYELKKVCCFMEINFIIWVKYSINVKPSNMSKEIFGKYTDR